MSTPFYNLTPTPTLTTTPSPSNITRTPTCVIGKHVTTYVIIAAILIILVIGGNLFVLLKIRPFESRRNRPNIEVFIAYLSVFDLLTSVFLIEDIYDNLTCFRKWPLGQIGCTLVYPLYYISLNMSVCILTIMSVDRYRSIVTPLRKKFTRRGIHTSVGIALIISILIQYYQFMHLKEGVTKYGGFVCKQDKGSRSFAIPKVISILTRDFLFMFVFTITSIWIYKTVSNNSILDLYYTDRKKKETRNVVKMLIVMEVVFTLLVVPFDFYDCLMHISRLIPGNHAIKFTYTLSYVDRILSVMQMSNSFANCFIYAKMHRYIPLRSVSTSTSTDFNYNNKRRSTSEYHHGDQRRSTKQEVIYTNSCYQPDEGDTK